MLEGAQGPSPRPSPKLAAFLRRVPPLLWASATHTTEGEWCRLSHLPQGWFPVPRSFRRSTGLSGDDGKWTVVEVQA